MWATISQQYYTYVSNQWISVKELDDCLTYIAKAHTTKTETTTGLFDNNIISTVTQEITEISKKARRKALPTANKKPTASKKCRNVKTALHVNQPYLYLCHNTLLQKCVWVYSWVFPIAKSHCQPNSQKLQQRMNICLMQLLATLISKKCVGVGLLV